MTRNELQEQLKEGSAALGGNLSPSAVERLVTLIEELERWGRRINLTALREREDIVGRHIMDSLAVRPHLQGNRLIDIGTGAGFPGLPLAICEPARDFVLLDASAKKLSFVRHIVGSLGLQNVDIVHARAEDYAPGERFDTVIARALASTAQLLTLGGHLVGEDGVLLALKGRRPTDELLDVPKDWHPSVMELAVPGLEGHARHVVVLERKSTH